MITPHPPLTLAAPHAKPRNCRWCREPHSARKCPLVKSFEFYPDGVVKKVEFWEGAGAVTEPQSEEAKSQGIVTMELYPASLIPRTGLKISPPAQAISMWQTETPEFDPTLTKSLR